MVMLVVMVVVMLGRHHRAAGGHDRGVGVAAGLAVGSGRRR